MANRPRKRSSKGQSVAEYSILVAVVLMACYGMYVYAKRGLQGRYLDAVLATKSALERKGVTGAFYYEPGFVGTALNQTVKDGGNKTWSAGGGREEASNSSLAITYWQNISVGKVD